MNLPGEHPRRHGLLGRAVPAAVVAALVVGALAGRAGAQPAVSGSMFTLTTSTSAPNGAWCWFEDERVIVDTSDPTRPLLLASTISAGAAAEAGDVDLLWRNLATGAQGDFELANQFQQDDHDSAALYQRPDGRYLAMYSRHGTDNFTRWRISTNPRDPTAWGPEQSLNNGAGATYNNVYHLPGENSGAGRTYNFTRAANYDPTVQVSTDDGSTWTAAGKLLTEGGSSDRPYVRYAASDERIFVFTTERHPRNYANSMYAGYVQNGVLHRMDGGVADGNVFDASGVAPSSLTRVFANGSTFDGTVMNRAWGTDLEVDNTGNPVGIFTARANDSDLDHRFFYSRFDGQQWQVHELARAGGYLYAAENDYTGLASIDPENPNVVYLSTKIDPRTQAGTAKYELYKGFTSDFGANWTWTPLTTASTVDNLRPVVPKWDGKNTAVTWMRGTYSSYTSWDTELVGMVLDDTDPKSLLWKGGQAWDVAAAAWDSGGGTVDGYQQGDEVAFDDSAATTAVSIATTVRPMGMAFANRTAAYMVTGSGIGGSGGLRVFGGGTTTLANAANTFTGDTLVARGTLRLAGGGQLAGSRTIEVSDGGTLDVAALDGGGLVLAQQTLSLDGRFVGDITATAGSVVEVAAGGRMTGNLHATASTIIAQGTIGGHLAATGGATVQVGGAGISAVRQTIYVDAAHGVGGNTTRSSGATFTPTTNPDWQIRSVFGNGGVVYQGGSDSPATAAELKTTISGLVPGTSYQVYVNFWDATGSAWRILAGGTSGRLKLFDSPRSAVAGATDGRDPTTLGYGTLPLIAESNRMLWAGDLGRLVADAQGRIAVYVDDTGTADGDDRTWYDGISYVSDPIGFTGQAVLAVQGNVAFDATSTLRLDMAGPSAFDAVAASGAASLGHGGLALALADGYDPAWLVPHTILTAASVSDSFAQVDATGLTAFKRLAVTYSSTSVMVTAAMAGDTNLDGVIDILDVSTFATAGLFNTNLPATWSEGDFNGDGLVDLLDAADLVNTGLYDSGPYARSTSSIALVPEPAPAALATTAVAAALAWCGRRRRRAALAVLALLTFGLPAARAQETLPLVTDMVLDDRALLFATNAPYGRAINGLAFQTETLLSAAGYQYATWYHLGSSDEDVYLGRRALTGTTWEVMDTGANMTRTTSDAHNTISMGLSSDGAIHLSFDHHGHTLRYVKSTTGAATAASWTPGLLLPERSSLNVGGTAVTVVTYPQFIADPVTNDMLMAYRIGGSGGGDMAIATYDAGTGLWNAPHEFIDGRDGVAYTDSLGTSTTRNAYLNGLDVDGTGRIHVTWTWRESAGGTNHDIDYAYSDDGGNTWRNNAGTVVGSSTTPIRYNSPGLIIDDGNAANGLLGQIDRRNTLMNQLTQAVDQDGRVHAIVWHAADAYANAVSGFSTAASAYFHYLRDPQTGAWSRRELPTERTVGSRPDMAYDADGNLYAAYVTQGDGDAGGYYTDGDLVIATASKATGFNDWRIVSTDTRDFIGEPRIDQERLLAGGVVSVFLQENNDLVASLTGTPLRVLEYTKLPNLVTWAGDHGGDWQPGGGLDWDDDGDDVGSTGFTAGERVVFDDGGSARAVRIAAAVAPSSVRFDNSAGHDYTLTGAAIHGSGSLLVDGGGRVTLANAANTFSAATTISAGTLALAGATSLASPVITIEQNGSLDASGLTGGLVLGSGQTLHHAGRRPLTGNVAAGPGSTIVGEGDFAGTVATQAAGLFRVGPAGITLRPHGLVIDTFEGYAIGDVGAVASPPWTAHLGSSLADITAAGTGNRALTIGGTVAGYVGASRSLATGVAIANTEIATLFFRFNPRTATLDQSFGLADLATTAGTAFTDFEAQFRLTGDTATTVRVDARDAAGFTAPLASGLRLDAWYNVWMVVDQTTDTYDVYLSSGTSDAVAANRLNTSPLRFRNGTSSPLNTLLGLAGRSPIDGPVWFDDLCRLDGASLSNPLRGSAGLLVGDAVAVSVGGDLDLLTGGTVAMDVATTEILDRLSVVGRATLAGTLRIDAPAGTVPALGTTFDVVTAGSIVGLPRIDDRGYLGLTAQVVGGTTLRLTTTARGGSIRTVADGLTVVDNAPFTDTLVLVKRGGGTLVRGGTSSLQEGAVVEAGSLVVTSAMALGGGPLTVRNGGTTSLQTDTLALDGLALDPGGVLDVGTTRLEIASGGIAAATLRDLLVAGRRDQAVSPGGIVSRVAGLAGLTVGHLTATNGSSVVRIAAPGDTNLDGLVDILDVGDIVGAGLFNTPLPATWATGDFNYDGLADILDLSDMLGGGFFNQAAYLPITAPVVAVPEPVLPTTAALSILSVVAFRIRRR